MAIRTVLLSLVGAMVIAALASASPAAADPAAGSLTVDAAVARGGTLDGSPGVPIADTRTNTVYIPIQCATSPCNGPAANVVDVIDGTRCNSRHADCRVTGRITVGVSPLHAVIDPGTDTMYVANAGATHPGGSAGSVSVVDISRCNAQTTSGCSGELANIPTGGFPVAIALDRARKTLYLADLSGHVLVVSTRGCNARTHSGCDQPVRRVDVAAGTAGIDLDSSTGTVYAVSVGDSGAANTLSIIDATRCNGADGSGCSRAPRTVAVGSGPGWVVFDKRARTVYTANYNDGSVSVLNAARCNAQVTDGCPPHAASVLTGAGAAYLSVDTSNHTLFVMNQQDDTLSAIDTRTCTGSTVSACPAKAPARQAAANNGSLYLGYPSFFALLPGVSTLYLVNEGGSNVVNVLSTIRCTAETSRGCRIEAPAVPRSAGDLALDATTDTLYVTSLVAPQIDVVAGRHCNAAGRSGCTPVGSIPVANSSLALSTVDPLTHTLYAVDGPTGQVAVIDVAACNARRADGCATAVRGSMPADAFATSAALNSLTRTLYVLYGPFDGTANHVAVLDIAHCNARSVSGCGQQPATVEVGVAARVVRVSQATNTVYVSNTGINFAGNTVSVIDGARCNGSIPSGCSAPVATATTGVGPNGIAVDDLRHKVYVANNAFGDAPGSVSVLDSRTCSGTHPTGCAGPYPAIPIGRAAHLSAVDPVDGTLYVADFSSAAVSVVRYPGVERRCAAGALQPIGSLPNAVVVNPYTHTVYASTLFGSGGLSIFSTRPHEDEARPTDGGTMTTGDLPCSATSPLTDPAPIATRVPTPRRLTTSASTPSAAAAKTRPESLSTLATRSGAGPVRP